MNSKRKLRFAAAIAWLIFAVAVLITVHNLAAVLVCVGISAVYSNSALDD